MVASSAEVAAPGEARSTGSVEQALVAGSQSIAYRASSTVPPRAESSPVADSATSDVPLVGDGVTESADVVAPGDARG